MPDTPHLIISYAAADEPGCQQALQNLQLSHLAQLLKQRQTTDTDTGEAEDFAPPHERALARALGLPTRATPWAALHQLQNGQLVDDAACAFITPCVWSIAPDQVRMRDLAAAAMSEDESRALLAILQPWFSEDGITLTYDRPDRWLARGEIFRNLETASLDRIALRDVRPWLPNKDQAAVLQRLQTETQMLLYTHAWSDAREATGRQPINSFWVHGAGALPAAYQLPAQMPVLNTELRDAALNGNWPAWQQQWQALDASAIAALAQHPSTLLTLCGEKNVITLAPSTSGWWQKLKQKLSAQRTSELLNAL
ncbi:MAG: phosphoglycerate mutase [Comamonas sp.]